MKAKLLILLVPGLLFVACAPKEIQTIQLDEKPKEQVILKRKAPKRVYKGTLYSREGSSLFADKKDLQIGDILQVNIRETLNNSSKNTRDLNKANTTALGGGIFAPSTGVTNSTGTAANIAKLNNALGVGFNTTTANTFKGSTSLKSDEEFSTVVSVVITQVYQNGNYFISGNKTLLIDNQKQNIGISGIIRPYDISPTNTVVSTQIANLKILYKKDGDDSKSLEKSWGTKVIESIWPF